MVDTDSDPCRPRQFWGQSATGPTKITRDMDLAKVERRVTQQQIETLREQAAQAHKEALYQTTTGGVPKNVQPFNQFDPYAVSFHDDNIPEQDELKRMTQDQPIPPAECKIVQDVLLQGGTVDDAEAAVHAHRRGEEAEWKGRAAAQAQRAKNEMMRHMYGGGRQIGKSIRADLSVRAGMPPAINHEMQRRAMEAEAVKANKPSVGEQEDGWYRKLLKGKFT